MLNCIEMCTPFHWDLHKNKVSVIQEHINVIDNLLYTLNLLFLGVQIYRFPPGRRPQVRAVSGEVGEAGGRRCVPCETGSYLRRTQSLLVPV